MHIDYSINNHCIICKIKYPKEILFCSVCGKRIRTGSKVVKSEVRERMKNLAAKRY